MHADRSMIASTLKIKINKEIYATDIYIYTVYIIIIIRIINKIYPTILL